MNYCPIDNGDEYERADEECMNDYLLDEENSRLSNSKLTSEQKKATKIVKEKEQYRQQSIDSHLFMSDPFHVKDFDTLVELSNQQKQLKSQIDALRTRIKAEMRDCGCSRAVNLEKGYQLTISKPRYTYNTHKEFDMDRFKDENPELYKKYLKSTYSDRNWSYGGNLVLKALSEKQINLYSSDELSQYFVRPILPTSDGYIPTCPQGYRDCVCDPAYIHFHYPDWYKKLYGEMTPEEASKEHCNINEECYDDEDK